MGIIATIATVVLSISLLTFVALFGRLPVFRHTPIAWLHRLFVVHIPSGVLAVDQKLTSGKFTSSLLRFGHFMMNDKHPTVLLLFLGLLLGSEYMALPTAWPRMSLLQKILVVIFIALPYIFLYLAAATDPGTVSLGNLRDHMRQYPYDYALFHPGPRCTTCNLLKPPRSKHCPICKRCIGRLDHHCIFINNCVGAGNHHYFLLLLLSTAVLTLYGGCVALNLVSHQIRLRYPTWSLIPWLARRASDPTQRLAMHEWFVVYSWGLKNQVSLGSVGLLGVLITPLVWGLFLFNLWNVYTGQTTNESLKWSDWQYDIRDGNVFRRRLARDRSRDGHHVHGEDGSPVVHAWTRWPVEPEHVLVRTDNGKPPPSVENAGIPGVGEWQRIRRLREVDNIYDIGFWGNLIDVFVPSHKFTSVDLPSVEVRGRPRKRVARR